MIKTGYHAKRAPLTLLSVLRHVISYFYYTFVRATYKCMMHVWTNTCEIERVMKEPWSYWAVKVLRFEHALLHSKSPDLRQLPSVPVDAAGDAMAVIVRQKGIDRRHLMQIQKPLMSCIMSLIGYNTLVKEVEWLRAKKYDGDNKEHEEKLLKLWAMAMPDVALEGRVTRQWSELGFQGDDPKTDFRGMGILGLEQLLFLFEQCSKTARHIQSSSKHPTIGFPLAIASISITAMCRDLLREGHLKSHYFNTIADKPDMHDFNRTYQLLFTHFITYWRDCGAESVMQFDSHRDIFAQQMRENLRQPSATIPPVSDQFN